MTVFVFKSVDRKSQITYLPQYQSYSIYTDRMMLNINLNLFFHYTDGISPRDHIIYEKKLIQLSQGNFIVICIVACMGILLCFGFLHFNIMNRKKR